MSYKGLRQLLMKVRARNNPDGPEALVPCPTCRAVVGEACDSAIGLHYNRVLDAIRAAIAQEREACAEMDPRSVRCPICVALAGEACMPTKKGEPHPHYERIAAAIRDRGASDEDA